jgi:putative FmdB family regulatory protein
MPIREFVCSLCGAGFEKIVRTSQSVDQLACPSCGSHHLERKLSSFAAHSGSAKSAAPAPVCPSGMCSNPGMCGINRN